MSKIKHLNLTEISETILRRVASNSDTVDAILHYHWRLIIHSVLHHDQVQVDDYIIIEKTREGFRIELTSKTKAYLK